MKKNNWIVLKKPQFKADIRLICLPYAGGGALVFNNWPEIFQDKIEVVIIQYPGRENRIREKPLDQINELTDCIFDAIQPLYDKHIAFFGHSMGSKIAYELIKKMQYSDTKRPLCFFASGGRGPNVMSRLNIYKLERNEFIDGLRHYNGTPEEILQDKEIMDMFMPLLRADFKADETYLDTEYIPIECPLYVLGGLKDTITSIDDLKTWSRYAKNGYQEKFFSSGHFFIKDRSVSVAEYVQKNLLSEFEKLTV